jgi:hypothetical protein
MPRPPAHLPAIVVLQAGIPLSLLLDLAAGSSLDSAEILAVEQATALARAEVQSGASERDGANVGKGESDVA